MAPPSVSEWLDGKDILITGSTGFMGKVLVEKLLRSCPRIKRLFLIMRPKRNCGPTERLATFRDALFQPLLEQYPDVLDKLVVIPGELSQPKCGISEEDRQLLKDNVSVIFHGAASVKFDESLSDAFKLNCRGTYELLQLAKEMPKFEVFEYVSTAYSNSYLTETIEEKVYPTHVNWKDLLSLMDKEDDVLDVMLYKVMWNQPNTYTFTKSVVENMVYEISKEIPCVIVRPSVVVPVHRDPVPGWVGQGLHGIVGVCAGIGKGILRVFRGSETSICDLVPVDVAINGMITAAWSTQLEKSEEVQVFNDTYRHSDNPTYTALLHYGEKCNSRYPMDNRIWFPFLILAYNNVSYHFFFFVYQILPALIMDLLLTLRGEKRMALKINIIIYNAMKVLTYFSTNNFVFRNEKRAIVYKQMSPEDQQQFVSMDQTDLNLAELTEKTQRGLKKYYFREKDEDLPALQARYQKFYYVHMATKYGSYVYCLWRFYIWAQAAITCSLFEC